MSCVYGRLTGYKLGDMEKKLSKGVGLEKQAGVRAMLPGGGLSGAGLEKGNGSWLANAGEGTLVCMAGRGRWNLLKI